MSLTYRELARMSDEDLITAHDQMAQHTFVGISYFLDELHRRDQARTNAVIMRLTWANATLSAVAVATAVIALLVR